MAFVKRDVKDRVVQYPRRYRLVEVSADVYDLVPVTGTVTEEGTAINKAYLQPIEDGLDAALEKTGDGKDVTVTFTEAATEAHIASGEKLSTLFGKILKKFKNVAPISHASSANTYGVGTTSNYGHVKTINNLTQSSHVNGTALSAHQGKILNDKMLSFYDTVVGSYTGDGTTDFSKVINLGFKPVLVMINSSKQGWDTVIVIREWDNQYSKIVDNGFAVARYGTGNFNNKSGQVYSYVAFR